MVKKVAIVGLLLVVSLTSVGFAGDTVVTSGVESGIGSFRLALQIACSDWSSSRCGVDCGGRYNNSNNVGEYPAKGDIQ